MLCSWREYPQWALPEINVSQSPALGGFLRFVPTDFQSMSLLGSFGDKKEPLPSVAALIRRDGKILVWYLYTQILHLLHQSTEPLVVFDRKR